MNYELLTSVMRRLAIEAVDAIMDIYQTNYFVVNVKSDKSPVTA